MSVQFRSRIKPALDYSTNLNSYGVCCSETGSKQFKSFYECFTEGGYFIPGISGSLDSVSCPEPDERLGTCCACKYVNVTDYNLLPPFPPDGIPTNPYLNSGIQNNISKCDCDRFGGKWTEGINTLTANTWIDLCVTGNKDVRYPKSCCYTTIDASTDFATSVNCIDVCSSADCGEYSLDEYPSFFDDTKRCNIPLIEDGDVQDCTSGTILPLIATSSVLYEDFEIGSCFNLELVDDSYEYTCSLTPQALCSGYWIEPQDADNAYCVTTQQPSNPTKVNGVYSVQRMTQSNFNSLNLSIGDDFQGGVYIGIFEPSPLNSKSSLVLGNINLQRSISTTRFNSDSVGGVDKKWAVIVDERPLNVPFLNSSESDVYYKTSLWDGYYNTYGNNTFSGIKTAITNTIKYIPRNGFIDYYIPSIYELAFYAAYKNTKAEAYSTSNLLSSSLFSTAYLNTNSNKTKIFNNKSFIYSQLYDINSLDNFRIVLSDKRSTQKMLLFRRIVIDS